MNTLEPTINQAIELSSRFNGELVDSSMKDLSFFSQNPKRKVLLRSMRHGEQAFFMPPPRSISACMAVIFRASHDDKPAEMFGYPLWIPAKNSESLMQIPDGKKELYHAFELIYGAYRFEQDRDVWQTFTPVEGVRLPQRRSRPNLMLESEAVQRKPGEPFLIMVPSKEEKAIMGDYQFFRENPHRTMRLRQWVGSTEDLFDKTEQSLNPQLLVLAARKGGGDSSEVQLLPMSFPGQVAEKLQERIELLSSEQQEEELRKNFDEIIGPAMRIHP